jgi:hypothetical protein
VRARSLVAIATTGGDCRLVADRVDHRILHTVIVIDEDVAFDHVIITIISCHDRRSRDGRE